MVYLRRSFVILVLALFIFVSTSTTLFAQDKVGIAVTVNCTSITVQVTSIVPNSTVVSIDVLDAAQTGSLLTAPATFTVQPGGVAQSTFQIREQPAATLVRYRVVVTDNGAQIGLATDDTGCIAFPPNISVTPPPAAPVISQQPPAFVQTPVAPVIVYVPVASSCNLVAGYRYVHVVQAGQNLFRIGLFYGVPFQTIAQVNGIGNVNRIYAGQCLQIP